MSKSLLKLCYKMCNICERAQPTGNILCTLANVLVKFSQSYEEMFFQ